MASPDSEVFKNLISERLKLVDNLVKAGKIDEAFKEITEIRKLDSSNPYAFAYEERIKSLRETSQVKPSTAPPTPPATQPSTDNAPGAGTRVRGDLAANQTPSTDTKKAERPAVPSAPIVPQPAATPQQSPPEPNKEHKSKGRILLVDDDEMLSGALSDLLEDEGYSATTISKAEDAIEYLKTTSPDLILCDVNLETSKFGGFTLHDKVRTFSHLRQVPFVFLSGLNDRAIVRAGKEVGADDYLTKPVEPEALLSVVKGKLKRYRQIKKGS